MILTTNIGSFNINYANTLSASLILQNESSKLVSYYNNIDVSVIKLLYSHVFNKIKFKTFFWHEAIGPVTVYEDKEDEDSEKILHSTMLLETLSKITDKNGKILLEDANNLNSMIVIFENLNEEYFDNDEIYNLIIPKKDIPKELAHKKVLYEYFFPINKKITEVNISEIKKYLKDKNIIDIDDDSGENPFYPNIIMMKYKNLLVFDKGKTWCFFEKEIFDQKKDLKPYSCIFFIGVEKKSPFIRGGNQIFGTIIPFAIINEEIKINPYDESFLRKEFSLGSEAFNIFINFLSNNDKKFNPNTDLKLLDNIKNNLNYLNDGKEITMNLDFFEEGNGFPFSELICEKNRDKLMNYMKIFLEVKDSNFKNLMLFSLISEAKKNMELSADKLFLNVMATACKKMNENIFNNKPELKNVYNIILNEFSKKNPSKKHEIIIGASDFIIKNDEAFFTPSPLQKAVKSLLAVEAYSPIETKIPIEFILNKASPFIHAALELA